MKSQLPHWQLPLQVFCLQDADVSPHAWVAPGAQGPAPPQPPQPPHWQDPLQVLVCVPQLPQPWLCVAPAAHAPCPLQAPQADHPPQVQPPVQLRERVCVPQLPQACDCVSFCPGEHWPPMGSVQAPFWQTLMPQALEFALQSIGAPLHWPPLHASLTVQLLLSSQPPFLGWVKHWPPWQTPLWHTPSNPEQFLGVPTHMPAVQVSPEVQGLPSSQRMPLLRALATHWPLTHMPVPQALFKLVQSNGFPLQPPPAQESPVVQGSPSSQEPSLGCWVHWPAWQEPM